MKSWRAFSILAWLLGDPKRALIWADHEPIESKLSFAPHYKLINDLSSNFSKFCLKLNGTKILSNLIYLVYIYTISNKLLTTQIRARVRVAWFVYRRYLVSSPAKLCIEKEKSKWTNTLFGSNITGTLNLVGPHIIKPNPRIRD